MRSRPEFVQTSGPFRLLFDSWMQFFRQFAMISFTCSVKAQPMDKKCTQLGLMCIPTKCPNCIRFLVHAQAGTACCPSAKALASAPSDGPPSAAPFSPSQVCRRVNVRIGGFCKQIVIAVNRILKCFSIRTLTGVAWNVPLGIPTCAYFSVFHLAERARKHP